MTQAWQGDFLYALQNLILKDFRIRYRNMSLGVFWSLLNPVVMMSVLTFVFTVIYPSRQADYPLFLMCGLVPFNFFAGSWITATTSMLDNAGLIKKVPVPRELIPISAVLSNCVHLLIQVALILILALIYTKGPNVHWLWIPVIWALEAMFVCGIGLMTAALNVYIRDTRYVVESANAVLFWLVPIFYGFNDIPQDYRLIYQFNPVAAVILTLRNIFIEGVAPRTQTLFILTGVAATFFLLGLVTFRKLKGGFYQHL
jgi:lipopolysaccharide transport system permease protein